MLSIISEVSERKHRRIKLQRKSGCCSILWHMARLKVILKTYVMSATQLWYRILGQHVPFTLLGELPLTVRITQVPNVFFWKLIIWCYWDSRTKAQVLLWDTVHSLCRTINPGQVQNISWTQSLSEKLYFRKYNS